MQGSRSKKKKGKRKMCFEKKFPRCARKIPTPQQPQKIDATHT